MIWCPFPWLVVSLIYTYMYETYIPYMYETPSIFFFSLNSHLFMFFKPYQMSFSILCITYIPICMYRTDPHYIFLSQTLSVFQVLVTRGGWYSFLCASENNLIFYSLWVCIIPCVSLGLLQRYINLVFIIISRCGISLTNCIAFFFSHFLSCLWYFLRLSLLNTRVFSEILWSSGFHTQYIDS